MVDQKNTAHSSPVFSTPRARTCAKERDVNYKLISGSGSDGLILERDILHYDIPRSPNVSPLAKKLALLHHVQTEHITGTGFHGKIMAEDIQKTYRSDHIPAEKKEPAPPLSKEDKYPECSEKIPLSGMRKFIADKMFDSLHTMAQANHRLTVDMSEAVHLREQLNECGIKISYNDIVIKCTAKALTEYPIMNATMTDTCILLKKDIHIGMAVAADGWLLVPVIKYTDKKTLSNIAAESKDLAARTKSGKLLPDEITQGTFTITNLGMYGIESFTAIINKPEAAILAVGKMDKKPVVYHDEIVIRPLMQLSLTYDHRIVDGAPAALFLRRIQQLMENPALLI